MPANNATTWMLAVFESNLPAPAKLTCAALRTFMNSHTEMAWPSVGRLAHMTSQSERTIQNHLKLLCDKKFLLRNGVSATGTNRYLISLEGVQEMHPAGDSPPQEVRGGVQEVPDGGAGDAPELNKINNNKQSFSQGCKEIALPDKKSEPEHYVQLAHWMWSLIQPITQSKRQPNFENWAKDLRLLVEKDGRTVDQVQSVFTWANRDQFWRSNILSAGKLRQQFPTLFAKMNSGPKRMDAQSVADRTNEMLRQLDQEGYGI